MCVMLEGGVWLELLTGVARFLLLTMSALASSYYPNTF